MKNAITGTGMTLERYSEIMQQMQGQPQDQEQGALPDISDDEHIQIGEAQQKLQQIQMEAQQKMLTIVEEGGMTIDRFQSILMAVRTDPSLQQRIQQYMQP